MSKRRRGYPQRGQGETRGPHRPWRGWASREARAQRLVPMRIGSTLSSGAACAAHGTTACRATTTAEP